MAIRCAYGVHTGLLQRLALPATAPRPAPNELQQGTVRTRHRNGRSSVTARGWPWSSRRGRSGSGVFPRLASTAWGGGGPDQPSPSGPRTSGARTAASGGHRDPTGRVPGVPGAGAAAALEDRVAGVLAANHVDSYQVVAQKGAAGGDLLFDGSRHEAGHAVIVMILEHLVVRGPRSNRRTASGAPVDGRGISWPRRWPGR
jgi:hypothetical protein